MQVHEIASQQGKDVAAAYAARHAERRFKQVGGRWQAQEVVGDLAELSSHGVMVSVRVFVCL
jgi:hypothetical protein